MMREKVRRIFTFCIVILIVVFFFSDYVKGSSSEPKQTPLGGTREQREDCRKEQVEPCPRGQEIFFIDGECKCCPFRWRLFRPNIPRCPTDE